MATRPTLLITRPEAQGRAFADAVEARFPGRFAPLVAPLMTIVPTGSAPAPDAMPDAMLDGLQGLVFTSTNGVAAFAAARPERHLPALCVGEATAAAARAAGFRAEAAGGEVESLGALVIARHRPGAGSFLHIRGRHAAGDLLGRLAAAGVPARAAELYDQVALPLPEAVRRRLAAREVAIVTLFSPRTARLFAAEAAMAGWDLGSVTLVAISPAADRAAAPLAAGRRLVAAAPTMAAMLAELARL